MKMKRVYSGEVTLKYRKAKNPEKLQIRSSKDSYNAFRKYIGEMVHHREAFMVQYLNQANQVMWMETHTIGTINSTQVDIKDIVKKALIGGVQSIILAHNHPSGNTQPSEADRKMTKRVREAAKLFDISVLDHIIVTDEKYYSFADQGERSLN